MTFSKEKRLSFFFIFVNIFYLTQGIVPALSIMYSVLLLFIFLISIIYIPKVHHLYGDSNFIKSLDIFVLLIGIYGVINLIQGADFQLRSMLPDYRPHTYLTNAFRPLLQLYPLYFFVRKGYINEDTIRFWVIPSMIAALVAFYVNDMTAEVSTADAGDVERTSNIGYLIVSIFPLLFFLKKNLIKYLLLSLVVIMVFISAKRGAILIAGLSTVWFLFFDLKKSTGKQKVTILLLMCLAGTFLYRYLSEVFEESYYLNYLLEKTIAGDSSGRDVLYSRAWKQFEDGSLLNVIFGYGADSTYTILGNRAHNDWLELLINQGIVGVLVYAILWFEIFRCWVKSKTNSNSLIFIVMGSIIIIFFMKTMFSMLYNDLSAIIAIPFAWCIASIDMKKTVLHRESHRDE